MLDIKVKNGEKQIHFKADGESNSVQEMLVRNAMNLMNEGGTVKVQEHVTQPKKPESNEVPSVSNVGNQSTETPKENREQKTGRSRQLPLRRPNEGIIQEVRPQQQSNQVACKIYCPECEEMATRHVKFGFRFTFCPACNEKLHIEPAAQEWGEKDEDGYTYHAFESYEEDAV